MKQDQSSAYFTLYVASLIVEMFISIVFLCELQFLYLLLSLPPVVAAALLLLTMQVKRSTDSGFYDFHI